MQVKGRGGHAALPHLSNDPVVAAAATIVALQSLVSRETVRVSSPCLSHRPLLNLALREAVRLFYQGIARCLVY